MDDQCNGDIKYRLNQERFLLNRVQNEVFVYSKSLRHYTFFEQLRNTQGIGVGRPLELGIKGLKT